MTTKDEYYAEFEKIDEPRVRERINLGQFGERKRKYAQGWLEQIERSRNDVSNLEQRAIARSAKNAAWAAAIAAIIAAIAAAVSIFISLYK